LQKLNPVDSLGNPEIAIFDFQGAAHQYPVKMVIIHIQYLNWFITFHVTTIKRILNLWAGIDCPYQFTEDFHLVYELIYASRQEVSDMNMRFLASDHVETIISKGSNLHLLGIDKS